MKIISLIIALGIFAIDCYSKGMIVNYFSQQSNHALVINDFLNFGLVHNKGISFGMFSNLKYSNECFIAIAVMITGFLIYLIATSKSNLETIAVSLIVGGAFGNIYDRFKYGYVVDFIDFHYQNHHWYIFNIADAAICLGVMIMIFKNYKVRNEKI